MSLIITDLSVLLVDNPGQDGLTLLEMASGVTTDQPRAQTEAELNAAGVRAAA